MIRVVLADDHSVVREGLGHLLAAQSDVAVVGEASTGHEALRVVRETNPDVVVLDIAMPDVDGIEVARRICRDTPSARCIILSMHSDAHYVRSALAAGALGFVVKSSSGKQLITAVRAVHDGQRYLSQDLLDELGGQLSGGSELNVEDALLDQLTPREQEVVRHLADGKSNARIAEILFLSPKSVATYRSRAMAKLGLDDLPALVKFAVRHHLTSDE